MKLYSEDELVNMEIDELDKIAFGYTSGQIIDIKTKDINLYLPDIENAEYKFKIYGMEWVKSVDLSEPVSLSIKQDGKFYLEDGHHRYFCAKKLGKNLIAEIDIKGNPVLKILEQQNKQKPKPKKNTL